LAPSRTITVHFASAELSRTTVFDPKLAEFAFSASATALMARTLLRGAPSRGLLRSLFLMDDFPEKFDDALRLKVPEIEIQDLNAAPLIISSKLHGVG